MAVSPLCGQVKIAPQVDRISVEIDGKPYCDFFLAPGGNKPYLYPLRTASGIVVTRHYPMEEGETRDHPWHHGMFFEHGAVNNGELTIECGPDSSIPQRQPWSGGGLAFCKLDRTPATGHLLVVFAIPYTEAEPVIPESLYTLCRVILHHHRDLPGCSQPVCVELGTCELDYWLRDTPIANKGERFVSYAGELPTCGPFMPASATPAPPIVSAISFQAGSLALSWSGGIAMRFFTGARVPFRSALMRV